MGGQERSPILGRAMAGILARILPKNKTVYREGDWRIRHDREDRIIVQCRTLGIWQDWQEQIGHDFWVTVTYPDYGAAIDFIDRMERG